jgi:hydroxymethylbilane synthase
MPIGAYAAISGAVMHMDAVVVSLDGGRRALATAEGAVAGAEALGHAIAEQLLAHGADAILADVLRVHAAVEGLQP